MASNPVHKPKNNDQTHQHVKNTVGRMRLHVVAKRYRQALLYCLTVCVVQHASIIGSG